MTKSLSPRSVFIGFDLGTQGGCSYAIDVEGNFLAKGDYPVPDPVNGTQNTEDWKTALKNSMSQLWAKLRKLGYKPSDCAAFCPSGQMHGLVITMEDGGVLNPVRLWCYPGSKQESEDLSDLFGINMPQRVTVVRWLEWLRENPSIAEKVVSITTPAGFLSTCLGGPSAEGLSFCEARGMFPINQNSLHYDSRMVALFDAIEPGISRRDIISLLPRAHMVGTVIGQVDEVGSMLSGLAIGTPIIAAAGDQGTALAGTYVWKEGVAAASLGTSICANTVTNQVFKGVHPGVEPFMTPGGTPFLMCHIENGTQWLNNMMYMFANAAGFGLKGKKLKGEVFQEFMPAAAAAPADCGGIIVLPFAKPEHGVYLAEEAHSAIFNVNSSNNYPGYLLRASLVAPMFTIRYSVEAMRKQGINASEYVLGGGILKKANFVAQMWADVFNTPTRILGATATEGSANGAALMALFGAKTKVAGEKIYWPEFLEKMRPSGGKLFKPQQERVGVYDQMFDAYAQLAEKVAPTLNHVGFIKK